VAKLNAVYASALLSLAGERALSPEYRDEITAVRDTLAHPGCKKLLLHPHIPNGEKLAFIERVFAGSLHPHLRAWLRVAVEKNREAFIVPALTALIAMVDRRGRKITASVTSPVRLKGAQSLAMRQALSAGSGKDVDIAQHVNPSLMGGTCVHAGDFYADLTIEHQLHNLTTYLKEGCGA
jgi:F-type H+-transporting ATPase subunit delta